jgi:uncharacterized DUF497 family protein
VKRLRFDWDPRKATANLRKHGMSFEEARTVFYDESALLRPTRTTRTRKIGSFFSDSAAGCGHWLSATAIGRQKKSSA